MNFEIVIQVFSIGVLLALSWSIYLIHKESINANGEYYKKWSIISPMFLLLVKYFFPVLFIFSVLKSFHLVFLILNP